MFAITFIFIKISYEDQGQQQIQRSSMSQKDNIEQPCVQVYNALRCGFFVKDEGTGR